MISDSPWELVYLSNGSTLSPPVILNIPPYSRLQVSLFVCLFVCLLVCLFVFTSILSFLGLNIAFTVHSF